MDMIEDGPRKTPKLTRALLYQKYLEKTKKSSKNVNPSQLFQMAIILLCAVPQEERFFFNKVQQILEDSAREDEEFDLEKASQAFHELENYILCIVNSPWKPEFRQLKLYNGFYRVKVQANLKRAIEVLNLIGFQKQDEDTLRLTYPVNVDLCLKVAFDMFIASAECKLLVPAFQTLLPKGVLSVEIIKARRLLTGDIEELQKYILQKLKTGEKYSYREHLLDERLFSESAVSKDSGYKSGSAQGKTKALFYTPDHYDTPPAFSQPLYEEATTDEHISAASEILGAQVPRNNHLDDKYEPNAGSEWNFVRQGLLSKYGESYYHGERGDILEKGRENPFVRNLKEKDETVGAVKGSRSRSPKLPPRVAHDPVSSSLPEADQGLTLKDKNTISCAPMVCRGNKPSHLPTTVSTDVCDGRLEDTVLPFTSDVLHRSLSGKRTTDIDTAASTKSEIFKSKLRDYEKVEQQLRIPVEHVNLEPNDVSRPMWSCPFCTYMNDPSDRVCKVCMKSASPAPDLTCPTYSRVCSKCTFLNEPTAKICALCEKSLNCFETVV